MKRICVIGAGIAGLTLARRLACLADVTVFEKSRGVGGRMATRRVDDFEFDHGTRFFTARSKAFQAFLEPLADLGLVAQWQPRVMTLAAGEKPYRRDWFEPHYVAVPTMTALCKTLAAEHAVALNTQITGLTAVGNTWHLSHEAAIMDESFDWVISTAPYPQTLALHCWRYASVEHACEDNYLLDVDNRLAACGDWCIDGRVEAAWQSANALADQLEHLL